MALSSLPPDFSFFLPYEINNYWIFGKNTLYTEINRLPSICLLYTSDAADE